MENFIMIRNIEYAEMMALKIGGRTINDSKDLQSISPRDGDTYLIDAHFEGDFIDLNILHSIVSLQRRIGEKNAQIHICSWLPREYILKSYPIDYCLRLPNVRFQQFPL